jgi:putative ABC transport system permease protein
MRQNRAGFGNPRQVLHHYAMLKFLPLLSASLRRHKLRTVFTLASVLIAFLLFGVLQAVKTGFAVGVDVAGADRLMVTHKTSFILSMPYAYWNQIRSLDGVREVTHATWFGGFYQDEANVIQMFPVDAESYMRIYGGDLKITPEDRKRWLVNRTGVLIGRAYADRFNWKVGDRIPLRSNIYRRANGSDTWEITVDGIFDAAKAGIDTQQVWMHYQTFDESLSGGDGGRRGMVGWYIVQLKSPDNAAAISAAVDKLFANSATETKTSTEKAFIQAFANQFGNIGAIVTAVASCVFFTMLLVTANTMAQSVRERAAEIGVLKTLGFADRTVLWLVLAESLAITVLGGTLGLGLAAFITTGARQALQQYLGAFYLSGTAFAVGVVLTVVLGLLSGAMPAVQALRLQIVDAIRRE